MPDPRATVGLRALLLAIVAAVLPVATTAAVESCDAVRSGDAARVVLRRAAGGEGPVEGYVITPSGDGPHPAVVVLHGSGGLRPPGCYARSARLLAHQGYVAIVVDSQTARLGSGGYSFGDQADDAFRAHSLLARMPSVDAARIGVLGYSKGGTAALTVISTSEPGHVDSRFRAAVAVYPQCFRAIPLRAPLLVLIGEADRVVSVPACLEMRPDSRRHGYELVTYPGVDHVFDLEGHRNYDEAAARDAAARMEAFFAKHLGTPGR